jgi:Eukaryotic glutathione synthase, ATP binding domain
VAYYRAGYVPVGYASPADYATRAVLKSSRAAQRPSIALQLAGAKKVQEVLSRPGVLERFLAPSEGADAVRDTWVGILSLDRDDGKGAEEAVRRAHELVLKPRRDLCMQSKLFSQKVLKSSVTCRSRANHVICNNQSDFLIGHVLGNSLTLSATFFRKKSCIACRLC